jgi:hypothetical protein
MIQSKEESIGSLTALAAQLQVRVSIVKEQFYMKKRFRLTSRNLSMHDHLHCPGCNHQFLFETQAFSACFATQGLESLQYELTGLFAKLCNHTRSCAERT